MNFHLHFFVVNHRAVHTYLKCRCGLRKVEVNEHQEDYPLDQEWLDGNINRGSRRQRPRPPRYG